jgi:hypothetical protein
MAGSFSLTSLVKLKRSRLTLSETQAAEVYPIDDVKLHSKSTIGIEVMLIRISLLMPTLCINGCKNKIWLPAFASKEQTPEEFQHS